MFVRHDTFCWIFDVVHYSPRLDFLASRSHAARGGNPFVRLLIHQYPASVCVRGGNKKHWNCPCALQRNITPPRLNLCCFTRWYFFSSLFLFIFFFHSYHTLLPMLWSVVYVLERMGWLLLSRSLGLYMSGRERTKQNKVEEKEQLTVASHSHQVETTRRMNTRDTMEMSWQRKEETWTRKH